MEDILHGKMNIKRLLIIGAGGFGRELLRWVLDLPLLERGWEVGGFLDDNLSALDGYDVGFGIEGCLLSYIPQQNDLFLCAIGDPVRKLEICREYKERDAKFIKFIHPTAILGRDCTLGEGCILCPGAIVTSDVHLGNFVTMNVYSVVGHDAIVADGCTLSPHADVNGCASIGEGVFLGSHAVVLPGATIGDYAIVGAGSVVLKKVKAGATVMGVPAKQIAGF